MTMSTMRRLNIEVVPLSEVPAEAVDVLQKAKAPLILIVDDEPIIADTLSSILRLHGFATVTAYDGLSAFEIASRISPSLLISDVAMPGMNGVELAKAVTQMLPECGVLLFSAHASSAELVNEQFELGPKFLFLQKPMHPEVMVMRVSDLLAA
jgi:DNA-binding NtrC family response regulator